MNLQNLEYVIAVRELELDHDQKITIKIGKPEIYPEADHHYCPYQILGIGKESIRYANGVDSVQALLLALSKIGIELYTSDEVKTGKLKWLGMTDLGFPLPESIKDLIPAQDLSQKSNFFF